MNLQADPVRMFGSVVTDYHQVFGYYLSGIALALLPAVPVVGLLVALARRRSSRGVRMASGLLAATFTAILLVTLTPGRMSYHPGVCAFYWTGTARDLGSTDGKLLNILMFVPLGFFAAMLVRRTRLPLLGALLLSPAIELTQRELPSLRRACDLVDVVDNVGGAVVGAVAGLVVVWAVSRFPVD
jgi:hypothetical protein